MCDREWCGSRSLVWKEPPWRDDLPATVRYSPVLLKGGYVMIVSIEATGSLATASMLSSVKGGIHAIRT